MTDALTPPPAATFRALHGIPVMFAGIVGVDAEWRPVDGTFAEEAEAVFTRLSDTLSDAGLGRDDVVSVRCYIADFGDFAEFNSAWSNYFGADAPPRTTVGAALHPPFRLEVEVVAARPGPGPRIKSEKGALS